MNYIYLSPHFPPNYYNFCIALRKYGVKVLGLADTQFDHLQSELQHALTEYFRVEDLHNYDQLVKALGYFTFKYGKIDGIDSNNEYWLETEAKLRTDFNINGFKLDTLDAIKCKSVMKKIFQAAEVPCARGSIVNDIKEAKKLIEGVGYPVVAKPDKGVGAANTFKIHNENELKSFFKTKPDIVYIVEEFIKGDICSFDGLTDQDGNLVFFTSHQYDKGVMEAVNEDHHIYYYSYRDVPKDIEDAGRKILKAFNVKGRFFHFEFFRLHENSEIVALEVNMRPPGGFTTDMFNWACDIDIYQEWANVVVNNKFDLEYTRRYHVCYISRKYSKQYQHSHEDILHRFGGMIVMHTELAPVLSQAMGNYAYIVRAKVLDPIFEAIDFIQKEN
jgi:biotin carboxylase